MDSFICLNHQQLLRTSSGMYGKFFVGLIHQQFFVHHLAWIPSVLSSINSCLYISWYAWSFICLIHQHQLYAAAKSEVTLLGMIDMSAAFDTVDHDILLGRLQTSFGICGAAMSWFSSFFRDRTQTVVINSQRSKTSLATSGFPQGSVLGPILFLLYSANIGLIAEKKRLNFHSYADDSELFLHCIAHVAAVTCLHVVLCIRYIDNWMASNRLKHNSDKTQLIMLGLRQQLAMLNCGSIRLGNVDIPFSPKVNCLAVILDAELTMVRHIRE